jgi:hypothetical protein
MVFLVSVPAQVYPEGGRNEFGVFRYAPPERFIALTRPAYTSAAEAKLAGDQSVVGLVVNGDARCFPVRQMWYHHVVNDDIGGERLSLTYCIMANTAVTYKLDSLERGLHVAGLFGGVLAMGMTGVSGVWAQIAPVPVPDNPTSSTLRTGPAPVITTFGLWRRVHPDTKVLAPVERFSLYYEAFDRKPKGYNGNPLMNETVVNRDDRLPPGTEVLGIGAGETAVACPLDWLKETGKHTLALGETTVTLVWDAALETGRVEGASEDAMWMRSYWYAWSEFYPKTGIVGERQP